MTFDHLHQATLCAVTGQRSRPLAEISRRVPGTTQPQTMRRLARLAAMRFVSEAPDGWRLTSAGIRARTVFSPGSVLRDAAIEIIGDLIESPEELGGDMGATPATLMRQYGHDRNRSDRILCTLHDLGWVERPRPGHYYGPTAAGEAWYREQPETRQAPRVSGKRLAMLEIMASEDRGWAPKELRQRLPRSYSPTVDADLSRLREEMLVRRVSPGVWTIRRLGRRAVGRARHESRRVADVAA